MISYNYPDYTDFPHQFPPEYASAWGEDRYGIWLEITVENVAQRFRWIPKGVFTMGSPESEEGRFGDELLQEVSLTQGLWLADTTCTQALWQAVMGENPAEFKDDPHNPIERVSWLDVQQFLSKLNQTLSNLKAHLPSEAQWEYACRAGTTTPFSFEGEIDLSKVNYSGKWDDSDFDDNALQKTAAVKSYPANAWGLYEMHGNVLEWTKDKWRNKAESKEKIMSDDYVMRGGGWRGDGRQCRSAIRVSSDVSDAFKHGGFRIALG